MNQQLDDLASQCVLAQANAKWHSRDLLVKALEAAFELGRAAGQKDVPESLDTLANESPVLAPLPVGQILLDHLR